MGQQLPLPFDPPPRAGRRIAAAGREADEVYEAVEALRAAGRRVYRAGSQHQVDGLNLSTRELLNLYEAELRQAAAGGANRSPVNALEGEGT